MKNEKIALIVKIVNLATSAIILINLIILSILTISPELSKQSILSQRWLLWQLGLSRFGESSGICPPVQLLVLIVTIVNLVIIVIILNF